MNPSEKKLFQALTDHDEKLLGAIFTTYNFDSDYFEETLLPGVFEIDMDDDTDSTLRTIDLLHALSETPIAVLMDSRSNFGVQRKISNYDLRPIWNAHQHSKIFCLVFSSAIKIFISSANITPNGIHRNREAYVQIDLNDENSDWDILKETIVFLRKIESANRLSKIPALDLLEQKFNELKPTTFQPTNLKLVCSSPIGDKIELAKEFNLFWKSNNMDGRVKPEIRTMYIQSPFFESSASNTKNLPLTLRTEFKKVLKQNNEVDFQIFFPTMDSKLLTEIQADIYNEIEEVYFYENPALTKEYRFPHLKTYLLTDHSYYSMYMMGSSNFSPSAFGFTTRKKPNWEANILFFKKEYSKKDLSIFFPNSVEIYDLTVRPQSPPSDTPKEDDLQDPIIIDSIYENKMLKIELLNGIPDDHNIYLGQLLLNHNFRENKLEIEINELPATTITVKKHEKTIQIFPITIKDLSFDEHLKTIPKDMIIKFIEARYKYQRDVRPSEVILKESKRSSGSAEDLQLDTSTYLLYQIKEFNILMTNLYARLKTSSIYLNQVQYHLNGKFGIYLLIEKHINEAKVSHSLVTSSFQALEIVTQALLAFEECKNQECLAELDLFFKKAMMSISTLQPHDEISSQFKIYLTGLHSLKDKLFTKVIV